MSSFVTVGRIIKARGVRGEFKVLPLTYSLERFDDISRVYVKVGDELREFSIEYTRCEGRLVVMKFPGIDAPEDVKPLLGRHLLIPEGESPPLPEGVYYYYQIVGLEVYTVEGACLGRVTDIIETGSNEVYVVREGKKEYLIPAIRGVIREIDIEGKRIVIYPVEGLL